MKLKLVTYPNKILEKIAEPIKEVKQKHKDLAASMHFWMLHWGGIGLAAPQVGRSIQLIVANDGKEKITLFNPKIIEVSPDLIEMQEGCLSIPNVFYTLKRPNSLTIEFLNEEGITTQRTFNGLMARILLHEYDHLLGITMNKLV